MGYLWRILYNALYTVFKLFDNGGPYHIDTSPSICSANQCTGFYMIRTSVEKELRGLLQELNYQAFIGRMISVLSQPEFTCSKSTMETSKQCVKSVHR